MPDPKIHALAPVAASLLLALGACATPADQAGLARPAFAAASLPAQTVAIPAVTAASWPTEAWWQDLGDPALNQLIATALASAPNLQAAVSRIERADAMVREAAAASLPSATLDESTSRARISESGMAPPMFRGHWATNASLGVSLSWALDIWGENKDRQSSARWQADAARADAAASRLALSTALAHTWVGLARAEALEADARSIEAGRRELLALQQQRNAAGLDAGVQRATSALADASRQLAQRHQAVIVIREQIAALAGLTPDQGLALPSPQLPGALQTAAPSSLPLDLVARRPDVIAALDRIEAGRRQEEVARKAFLPNINLAGLVGFQSIGLSHLIDGGSYAPSLGPAIHLPIFSGGRLQAQLDERRSDTDTAVLAYEQAVLDALRDVAQSSAALDGALATRDSAQRGEAAASILDSQASERFQRGIASRIDLINAHEALTLAHQARIDADMGVLEARIDLTRSLGGGYRADPSAPPASRPQGT